MKWRRGRRSGDLQDRRGGSRLGGGAAIGAGIGLPAIAILLIAMFLGGGSGEGGLPEIDDILGGLDNAQGRGEPIPPEEDPDRRLVDFMSFVLDDVQNFWERTFSESDQSYERAQLVLFEGSTQSGCGGATSSIGPHYCPPDQKVYLDLDFFRALRRDFGAPGDFAQAYVLAHEIGHHLQNILGIEREVRAAQQEDPDAANELSVRMELQADCFAGVWGYSTDQRDLLDPGDLDEGLDAAESVGDDRIQSQAGGRVNPETWTHGSSEQRKRWFRVGFDSGDPSRCNTFEADEL